MAGSRSIRLVQASLRCYPERWRSRHGEEAAELARLLMRDGMPARSIAWSYLIGAAGTRLVLPPGRRLGAAVGALVAAACSLSVSLAVVSSSAPASAASVVRLRITDRAAAAGQLRSLARAHHFGIAVTQEPVSPSLVGSIITIGAGGPSAGRGNVLSGIAGPCSGGAWGCVDGIVLPVHFTGAARIVVGRAARPGEKYAAAAGIFRPGEPLHCTALLGEGVRQALPVLEGLHLKVSWDTGGGPAARGRIADGHYYVAGGAARSAGSITIRVTANKPARRAAGSRHGQNC